MSPLVLAVLLEKRTVHLHRKYREKEGERREVDRDREGAMIYTATFHVCFITTDNIVGLKQH